MLRVFFDQNFNHRILAGLIHRIPNLDLVTTQIINNIRELDPKLLTLAAAESRVILTHDKKTFPKHAYAAIVSGQIISGLLVVPSKLNIGKAIDELELIIQCSDENEFENRVEFLPFIGT